MRIAGISRFSSVDWPGKLVATLFLQGCPWDCFYCHNPELISPRRAGRISWQSVHDFLETRKGLLDGVVFSGGEPTMQRALIPALQQARALGFAVGLHSGGAYPALLTDALPLIDWIGLDIKARRDDYSDTTGRTRSGDNAWRSLDTVVAASRARSGTAHPLDYEVRTTVHPGVLDAMALSSLADDVAKAGADTWMLQHYRPIGVRAARIPAATAPYDLESAAAGLGTGRFQRFGIR
nr:anaerobic ribonucleoside-triphosphate reductase activating protein [Microbacterium endophyticum]